EHHCRIALTAVWKRAASGPLHSFRTGGRTADDIATQLGLTATAAHAQSAAMECAGVVEKVAWEWSDERHTAAANHWHDGCGKNGDARRSDRSADRRRS